MAAGREQLFFGFNRQVFPSSLHISAVQHEHFHRLSLFLPLCRISPPGVLEMVVHGTAKRGLVR